MIDKGRANGDAKCSEVGSASAEATNAIVGRGLFEHKDCGAGDGNEAGGRGGSFTSDGVCNGVEDSGDMDESFDPWGLCNPVFKWRENDSHVGGLDETKTVSVHGDDFAVATDDDVGSAVLCEDGRAETESGKDSMPGTLCLGDLGRADMR